MKSGQSGFTLLEALVVLIITGLVSVVLVQGFGLILAARTSVQDKLVDIDQQVIQRNVFLEPLRGILPDYPNRPNVFSGDARRLHGLTVRPLEERPGVPVSFTMWLDYDRGENQTSLAYQEQGAEILVLARWSGERGSFAYRDRTGDWTAVWPPAQNVDQAPQTPWLIRVDLGFGYPQSVIASVAGAHQRPLRLLDTPLGSSSSGLN